MGDEAFVSNFPAWQSQLEKQFPIYEPVTEWRINADIKDSTVSFDPRKASLNIIPRFSKKTGKAGFDWSIRSPKGCLTMNMHSGLNLTRSYQELRLEFEPWLQSWIDNFKVDEFQRVNLHYVNFLNRVAMPDFATNDGRLDIDKIITVFVHLPGQYQEIVPPLDCKLNLKLRSDPYATLLIHLLSQSGPGLPSPTLRLDFVVDALTPSGTTKSELLDLLDWCHDRIIEQFQVVFTQEAIKSFYLTDK